VADGTPTLLDLLLDAGLDRAALPALRHLILGGETLRADALHRLRANPGLTRLTIHNITFNSGSYAITSVDDPNMQYLVKYLNDFPSIHLKVGGHTDNEGSEQFNLDLSRKRAEAVKTWLVEQGIEATRISTTGFGKNKPLAPQKTAEQKALNRRVELTLYENN
jgi:outer membrane protein OmpA-like peptidoglycan-associated protein